MSFYYGYFRRCTDEPLAPYFTLRDFRHAIATRTSAPHYDILSGTVDGVVHAGVTYIRASPEQELIVNYLRIY